MTLDHLVFIGREPCTLSDDAANAMTGTTPERLQDASGMTADWLQRGIVRRDDIPRYFQQMLVASGMRDEQLVRDVFREAITYLLTRHIEVADALLPDAKDEKLRVYLARIGIGDSASEAQLMYLERTYGALMDRADDDVAFFLQEFPKLQRGAIIPSGGKP